MKSIIQTIKRRWFGEVDPTRLAFIRIATGCFSLWYLVSRFNMLQAMVKNTAAFDPIGIIAWMEQPLNATVFWWVSIVLIALNACYILGWKFKYTGPAFAILMLFFFTYRNSWSMIYHNRNALVLHIIILGFVASADAWSLDALGNGRKGTTEKGPHWKYGWPIMLLSTVTVGSYLLAGVAKISGDLAWGWANGNAMRSQIAVDAIRKSILGEEIPSFFGLLYENTWLFLWMGVFALVLEIGAPIALIKKYWGVVWAVMTWLMHWGIFFIMGIQFRYQMTGLIFLSFFRPEKWFTRARKKVAHTNDGSLKLSADKEASPVILFDGVCNLCNGWVRFVMGNERRPEFLFASLQSNTAKKMLDSFNMENSMDSIVLIEDGILYQKSEAVLRILGRLRFVWPLLTVLVIVPIFIRDGIYNLIAHYRYTWFGKQRSCGLMDTDDKFRFIDP